MQVVGSFNKISEKLAATLKPLKPGQTVTIELLNFEIDHPTGRRLYGGSVSLPGRDTIRDLDGNFVDIGIPRVIENGTVKKVEEFVLNGGESTMVSGRFDLSGDNLQHVKWWEFFQLANYNKSNPNASPSEKKLIAVVDHKAEVEKRRGKRSAKKDAMVLADKLSASEIKIIAASLNWDTEIDPEILSDRVAAYAEQNPEDFLARAKGERTKDIANLGIARELGVIFLDQATNSVKNKEGEVLVILDKHMADKNWVEYAYNTLSKMKDGPTIISGINAAADEAAKRKEQGAGDEAMG